MKKIAIVTATRAEYGLLYPVITALRNKETEGIKVHLIVTGTHLSERYGTTINDIKADGIRIDHIIPITVNSDSEVDISSNQAMTLVKFTELFSQERYNGVVLLGDRYEILSVAIAAGNTRIPIFHLCGGDTSEGATDEWIRHSITKMSYLHFVTNEESRKRVIQLGEDPCRVFNYGSTSIDNILNKTALTREELLKGLCLEECRYAICTYHPVTMEEDTATKQIEDIIKAIKAFPTIQFIFTKANADQGGSKINLLLEDAEKSTDNLHVFTSLGTERYLSALKYAEFVLGNSSSGIIEAPALKVPTVNIGDRQRGRLQSDSIINCDTESEAIIEAINEAIDSEFKKKCKKTKSKYGSGNAGIRIAERIYITVENDNIDLKKRFYNL